MVLRLTAFLAGPIIRAGLVFEVCAGLLLWKRWRPAVFLAATVGATGAVTMTLKHVVDRNRPQPILRLQPRPNSFPSGHASGTTALVGAIAYILWLLTGRAALTAAAVVCGAVVAGVVGYSRVALHRHHPTDVLAGHALGLGCLVVAILADQRLARRKP